jgi:hypothetical protein
MATQEGRLMLYMFLISAAETGAQAPDSLGEAVEKLAEEETAAGRMIARGGLLPSFESKRGKLKVLDGPFAETKEVLGGFAIFELATREEALACGQRFIDLHLEHWPEFECVCEMRPMFGFGATGGAATEDAAKLSA